MTVIPDSDISSNCSRTQVSTILSTTGARKTIKIHTHKSMYANIAFDANLLMSSKQARYPDRFNDVNDCGRNADRTVSSDACIEAHERFKLFKLQHKKPELYSWKQFLWRSAMNGHRPAHHENARPVRNTPSDVSPLHMHKLSTCISRL